MYDDLPLPWTVEPVVAEFPFPTKHNGDDTEDAPTSNTIPNNGEKSLPNLTFIRKEWNRNGALTTETQDFFRGHIRQSLEELARGLGTASMVTRWREVNHVRVQAGEVEDCVDMTIRKMREAMGGRDWIDGGSGTVVLLFKKRV